MAHSIVNGSRSRGSAVALLAVAIAISPPLSQTALAQAVLEEIVVTARKRDENLQEVPIAITALSGDAIERLGFQSPGQIATQIPNVQFNDEGTIPQFNIRGIQLNDFGDGNEAPVAFYIDEVYKGTLAGQTVGLFDLERVEVLRGPQGTLFGRNTTGGLAHFVTRKPTVEGEGYLSAQLGSFSQTIIEGALSGPLAEAARGRIAAKYNKDDGWQGNTQNSSRFAATDALALRASLEVDLSDSAMLSAMVHYGDQDNVSQGYGLAGTLNPTNRAPCSGSEILAGGCVTAIGEPSNLNPRLANTEQDTLQFKNSTSGGYLRFDWSVGNALEFVSISAVERVDKFFQEDSDASPNPVNNSLRIVTGGAVPLDLPAFLSNYSVESSQFTQEFRLSGDREKLNWVLGAFYYTDGKDPLRFEVPQAEATLGSPTGIGNDASLDTDSWAVFAQTDWWLTDTTNLIVGVRFTEDEKDLTISDSATNPTFVDNEFLST
ncbi:MAG: TonB-dependent receptor, partial [Rhodospirillaceae bacterium]|nr:TonB-dependent receptor [Rhodospirillaceae bacterium]